VIFGIPIFDGKKIASYELVIIESYFNFYMPDHSLVFLLYISVILIFYRAGLLIPSSAYDIKFHLPRDWRFSDFLALFDD
jgi:hypothetical protein